MGLSGFGKFILFNIFGCLDQVNEGFYKIDGVLVKNLS